MKNEHLTKMQDSLTARLKAGEHSAAEELVDKYYEQIYLFMRRLGHDRQESEDLTQDSFIQAWHHICQLKDGKALNSWLYRIAGNASKRCWRRNKNKKTVSIDGIQLPDGDSSKGDKIERIEQLDLLKRIIVELPVKMKQTIVLHYMQDLTIAEAAEAAGVNEGTFKSRLHRALESLRKQVT